MFIFTCGCALRFFVFTLFFVRNSHLNITTIIISIIIITLIIIITRIKPQVKRLDYRGRYVGSHPDLGSGAKVSPANSGGAHQIILLALLCKILHFCAKWCRPIILFVLLCTTPNYTLLIVHKTVRLRNYRDYIWSIGGDAN